MEFLSATTPHGSAITFDVLHGSRESTGGARNTPGDNATCYHLSSVAEFLSRMTEGAPWRGQFAMLATAAFFVTGRLLGSPLASAAPSQFPDIDFYGQVDSTDYQVLGAHPSLSGWTFSTAAGLRCQDNFNAELGVFCQVTPPDPIARHTWVSASVSNEGHASQTGADLRDVAYPLLPTGMRIATDNGVSCAVLTDETLACRALIPAKWGPNVPNPPDRVYGEHGFVVSPAGRTTF